MWMRVGWVGKRAADFTPTEVEILNGHGKKIRARFAKTVCFWYDARKTGTGSVAGRKTIGVLG